jgi:CubicO group peptidase (beta-lactamase class C family)
MTSALAQVRHWASPATAGVVVGRTGTHPSIVSSEGDPGAPFRLASVTKVLTALTLWIASEEGTVSWDDPAGPPGATLGDLMSHASGLAPHDDRVLAPPRTRRIYSNRGIEIAAAHLSERAGMAFNEYMSLGLLEPLGLEGVTLEGSPAHGGTGTLQDLLLVANELLRPKLLSPETLSVCTRVATPGLTGVLPGFGRQQSNDWGLGVEIRDHKEPHWTGARNSPSTFGHFGQSGCFIWVDPQLGLALAVLSDQAFGPWAAESWPKLSDAVISEHAA